MVVPVDPTVPTLVATAGLFGGILGHGQRHFEDDDGSTGGGRKQQKNNKKTEKGRTNNMKKKLHTS